MPLQQWWDGELFLSHIVLSSAFWSIWCVKKSFFMCVIIVVRNTFFSRQEMEQNRSFSFILHDSYFNSFSYHLSLERLSLTLFLIHLMKKILFLHFFSFFYYFYVCLWLYVCLMCINEMIHKFLIEWIYDLVTHVIHNFYIDWFFFLISSSLNELSWKVLCSDVEIEIILKLSEKCLEY